MNRRRTGALLAALLCLLTGCAGSTTPADTSYMPPEEERLVIYTSHKEEVWWPIVKEFEERTGIWVDVVTGGSSQLLEQIRQEREAPRADVMFGGGVESLESYSDCLEPYACSEKAQIPERYRSEKDLWTPFSSLPVVLIYNTKLVDPSWLTSWSDLLSDRFRGKIAFADPGVSGSSFTSLVTYLDAMGRSPEECLPQLAASLEDRQLDSSGDVLSAVAQGSDWVGITLEETALQWIAAGEDLGMVYPSDGTSSVPDGSALVAGAPHRENAEKFLDFTVSLDVQQLLARQFYRRPVREDVETGKTLVPLFELKLVDYDVEWASRERESLLMSWAFYLGGEEEL